MNFEVKREEVEAALAKAPALRPLLTRLARKAANGKMLPVNFSAKGLDYEAQCVLEGIMKLPTVRAADGTVRGIFSPDIRKPVAWGKVFDLLLDAEELAPKAESVEDFLEKLRWRDPDRVMTIDQLSRMPEVIRHLQSTENRSSWLAVYLGAVDMAMHGERGVLTLSQLGSDWLNDSKALRAGGLRRQLAIILGVMCGFDPDEESALFGSFGIVDNPYTSSVTVFAPFAFKLKDGTVLDFPAQMFDAGLACQMPLEVVNNIANITRRGEPVLLRTCENAAPFSEMVSRGIPVVYTEGYPNYAVQRLLGWFERAGFEVEHWGDCDLDGFRIAQLVSTRIPVLRVVASEIIDNPGNVLGIPMTDNQRERLEHFLELQGDFAYAAELRHLLALGCWYEQEAFPL